MDLTASVRRWQELGTPAEFRGRQIHTHVREGDGPLIALLHGFPSSSYDWMQLLEEEPLRGQASIAFDFLGFGLSDKPQDHEYSLFWQADLAEEVIRRSAGDRPVFIVAHDMGTSVTTELMARDLEGRLDMDLAGVLLFNGSIVLDRATLTPSQKLLRSRLGPIAARLSNERVFRQQFGSVFSAAHPLSDAEAADQWSLICHNGGRTLGHKLIFYLGERIEFADRWHGAIRDWARLQLAWGMRDPVATPEVLAALRELHPGVPVTELPDLGHYPQLEDPQRMGRVVREAVQTLEC